MNIKIHQETRIGGRHTNQDRIGYLYTKDSLLMIVCDGMGGHLKGEIAAEFVTHYLAKAFRALAQPRLKDPSLFLKRAIAAAHEGLIRFAQKQEMAEVPRTTCVASVIQDGRVHWAHVGDSRLYLFRGGQLQGQTIDHSHVQLLIDAGKISKEQAAIHPERNKIFNCIGQPVPPRIDVAGPTALRPNDIMVLATDGLWAPVPANILNRAIDRYGPEVGCSMCMDLSETISGRECDNLSCVVLQWDPSDEHRPHPFDDGGFVEDEDLTLAMHWIESAALKRSLVL